MLWKLKRCDGEKKWRSNKLLMNSFLLRQRITIQFFLFVIESCIQTENGMTFFCWCRCRVAHGKEKEKSKYSDELISVAQKKSLFDQHVYRSISLILQSRCLGRWKDGSRQVSTEELIILWLWSYMVASYKLKSFRSAH